MEICFHHLVAQCHENVTSDIVNDKAKFDEYVKNNVREFLHAIYKELPRETSDEGTLAVLSPIYERKIKLPRSQPIPAAKRISTKWEEFARKKGIQKRKKEGLVFDEVDQNWKIRYGGRGIKRTQEKRDIIIEHKPGSDPYVDPFQQRSEEKSLRKAKQSLQEVTNKVRKAGYQLPRAKQQSKKKKK